MGDVRDIKYRGGVNESLEYLALAIDHTVCIGVIGHLEFDVLGQYSVAIDTLSLPYTQGTDLTVQVVGWIKPSLPLPRRPLRVVILGRGGHQTQRCCWITLLVPCVRAVVSGA